MKRIWFSVAIACLAITGTARAELFGRLWQGSLVSTSEEKAPVATTVAGGGPVQAAEKGSPIQHDGYPFADRCGCNTPNCCGNVWDGYLPSCGLGLGRGLFAHGGHGCGKCGHAHGLAHGLKSCGCCDGAGFGGYGNSFAGGAFYGNCGSGCGGLGLPSLVGCGCGHHMFGGLRRLCGLDCGCSDCGNSPAGCSTCNGGGDKSEKIMNPPAAPLDPTPADLVPDAKTPAEKSAFRPWGGHSTSVFRGGF